MRYISIGLAIVMGCTPAMLVACPAPELEDNVLFQNEPKDVPNGLKTIHVHFLYQGRDKNTLSVGMARQGNSMSIWLPKFFYSSQAYFPVYYPVNSCTRGLLGKSPMEERTYLVGKFRKTLSGQRYFAAASRSQYGRWQFPNLTIP
jgi:hypothetical protein